MNFISELLVNLLDDKGNEFPMALLLKYSPSEDPTEILIGCPFGKVKGMFLVVVGQLSVS